MLELVAGVVLAAAAVGFVLKPILAPTAAQGQEPLAPPNEGDDPDDDFSPSAVALRALKEIEFDRATGKLSEADYAALERQYTAEAIAALRATAESGGAPAPTGADAASAGTPGRAAPAAACPTHGPRPERDAVFCSQCGRRLASAPGFCARCGTALERDARYCHSCGTRVAA